MCEVCAKNRPASHALCAFQKHSDSQAHMTANHYSPSQGGMRLGLSHRKHQVCSQGPSSLLSRASRYNATWHLFNLDPRHQGSHPSACSWHLSCWQIVRQQFLHVAFPPSCAPGERRSWIPSTCSSAIKASDSRLSVSRDRRCERTGLSWSRFASCNPTARNTQDRPNPISPAAGKKDMRKDW